MTSVESMRQELAEREADLEIIDDQWLHNQIVKRCNDLRNAIRWLTQPYQCSDPGVSHGPHGACSGYSRDRT